MEAADKNIPLDLNAFVLKKKAIDGMANAELHNAKPMKSGSLYWSRGKTTMQKSLEDNQTTGLFSCQSFTT